MPDEVALRLHPVPRPAAVIFRSATPSVAANNSVHKRRMEGWELGAGCSEGVLHGWPVDQQKVVRQLQARAVHRGTVRPHRSAKLSKAPAPSQTSSASLSPKRQKALKAHARSVPSGHRGSPSAAASSVSIFHERQSARLGDPTHVRGGALTDGEAGMQLPSTTLRGLSNWLVISGQRTALRKARHNQSQPLRSADGLFLAGLKISDMGSLLVRAGGARSNVLSRYPHQYWW